MLDRLAGNAALKQDLAAALAADRLAHSILLVGETGCGAGFAARCLAADYLYPAGGPTQRSTVRCSAARTASASPCGGGGCLRAD